MTKYQTELAKTAKPSAKAAAFGENYICPRCKGEGSGTWYVQMGVCFKCEGSGVVKKTDPNEVLTKTVYIVKNEGEVFAFRVDCDLHKGLDTSLWIGQTVNVALTSKGKARDLKIVAKYYKEYTRKGTVLLEKKSKDYDAFFNHKDTY